MTSLDLRNKILNAAQKRMIRFGYRKVTMDEIASDLAMSKNTIYKSFASKEEVAKCLVKRLQQQINEGLLEIEKTQKDPLQAFSSCVLLMRKQLAPWFEHFFREIEVELPELWREFVRYRNEKILEIRRFVDQGIRKGMFRKVRPAVAVQAYLGAVKAILSPRFLEEEKISFDQALEEILDIWSNGIISKKKGS